MQNVNDQYFDGHYKDIWRSIIPEQLTIRETDFIVEQFHLQPGSRVLDLMCGYGRHALALGRRGIDVTAVDNLEAYITEVNLLASAESLPVKAIQSSILSFQPEGRFDLALCMGNSLNFFNREDTITLLTRIASCLQKNGHLLINTWSLAEIAIKQYIEKAWSEVNGLKVLSDNKYLLEPTRIESITSFIDGDRVIETKHAIDYIFSYAEFKEILKASNFELVKAYAIPGKKEFAFGDPRAYLVCQLKA